MHYIEKLTQPKKKILFFICFFIASILLARGSTEKRETPLSTPDGNEQIQVSDQEKIAKLEKEIRELKDEIAVKDLKLDRQNIKKRNYAIGFILLLFLILVVLHLYRTKRKSEAHLETALEKARNEVEERKKIERENEELQSRLIHSKKMESMGRLAGGIAHEFNNLLTGIMGYADMLKMKYSDKNKFEGKAADIIYRGSVQAQELTKGLLGFARRDTYNPVSLNLNDLIKNTIETSEKTLGQDMAINYNLGDQIGLVKADKSQMQHLLSHLISNAKDACPGGGKITFQTGNVRIEEDQEGSPHEIVKPGLYVRFSIFDTGTGMTEEIKDRIFDPFYTTKPVGKGTGLGLAAVYGIVKGHGGYIFCDSEPGKGTTFTIYLRRREAEVDLDEKIKYKAGSRTVLVIDDEDIVLYSTKDMLQKLGYEVLLASSGKQGLDIYQKNRDRIDLIMLDCIMPDMNGEETLKAIKEIDDRIKVLLISGYKKEEIVTETLTKGSLGFLKKPFNMNDLSTLVRQALSAPVT